MLLITTGKTSGEAYRGEWGKVLSVVWWSLALLAGVGAGSWVAAPWYMLLWGHAWPLVMALSSGKALPPV